MNHEHLEARVAESAPPGEFPVGDYRLSVRQLFTLVAFAYEADRDYGYGNREGGKYIVNPFDVGVRRVQI